MTMIVKYSGSLLLLSLYFLKIPSILAVPQVNGTLSPTEEENNNEIDRNRGSKIVGGYRCPITKYPFLVSLRHVNSQKHICAGTLISKVWVLTAMHCLKDICHLSLEVIAGSNYASNVKKDSDNREIQFSTILRCYLYTIQDPYLYDIALAKLKKPILETNTVGYVKLPFSLFSNDGSLKGACSNTTVAGWRTQYATNFTHDPITANILKHDFHLQCVHLPIISREVCKSRMGYPLSPSSFCTFYPLHDVCFGDSGGPLMCDDYQYGIVSYGHGCAYGNNPAIFTNITHFREFILTTVGFRDEAKSTANSICAIKFSVVLVISNLYLQD